MKIYKQIASLMLIGVCSNVSTVICSQGSQAENIVFDYIEKIIKKDPEINTPGETDKNLVNVLKTSVQTAQDTNNDFVITDLKGNDITQYILQINDQLLLNTYLLCLRQAALQGPIGSGDFNAASFRSLCQAAATNDQEKQAMIQGLAALGFHLDQIQSTVSTAWYNFYITIGSLALSVVLVIKVFFFPSNTDSYSDGYLDDEDDEDDNYDETKDE